MNLYGPVKKMDLIIYLVIFLTIPEKQLTGQWDITKVYGYNFKDQSIYFQAAKNNTMTKKFILLV